MARDLKKRPLEYQRPKSREETPQKGMDDESDFNIRLKYALRDQLDQCADRRCVSIVVELLRLRAGDVQLSQKSCSK